MKKSILVTVSILLCLFGSAQVTLEHFSSEYSYLNPIKFTANGEKLIGYSITTGQVTIFNTDYTVWKTITPPVLAGHYRANIYSISDRLVDLDDNLEYLVYWADSTTYRYKWAMYDEVDGQLFFFGEKNIINQHYVNGGYKLHATGYDTSITIYSLPGDLPCGHCSSGVGIPRTSQMGSNSAIISPNPTSGLVTIDYNIPLGTSGTLRITTIEGKLVLNQSLDGGKSNLAIDMSPYSPGIYYYTISAPNSISATGTIVR